MADDLDAELLALAGDSSDEESLPPQTQKPDSPVSSPPSQTQEEPLPMARKGVAKTVRRHKKQKKVDMEDGELSSADSHKSLQSASMSESESESEGSGAEPDEDAPIFPYEKLYHSAQDKADIMAMPEIQREQLLSERAQQVDRHNQDLALRRLLASREREETRLAKKAKRKAGAAGLDETQRKSSRQKTMLGGRKVGEVSGAIEAYKRQREQKGKRDELRRRDATTKDGRSLGKDGDVSEADAEGESEVVWDERAERSPSVPKDDPPAELKDIQRARIGRSNFAQVCFYPGFDSAISGCYARVNVGINKETGQNEYRVSLIRKFTEGRPYAMEGPNGRSFVTNQYAVLAHGKSEREFPFIACSNSPFTESEFYRYRQTMIVEDCKMATVSMVAKKVADINRLLNHQFTKEELNEKLRKQGSLDSKMQALKRFDTERSLMVARAQGDEAEIERLESELRQLMGPKLAYGTSLYKSQSDKKSESERLAEINLRNQKLNYETVRRAQLEERKASRKAAVAVARGEAVADPFMRVKTRAKILHDINGQSSAAKAESPTVPAGQNPGQSKNGDSKASAEADGSGNASKNNDSFKSSQKSTVLGMIRHRNMDDENIAALDLDIDIEI